MGGNINYVPLVGNDFRFDLEAVRAAITDRTRLVFICSPNNPTGSAVAQKELSASWNLCRPVFWWSWTKRTMNMLPPGSSQHPAVYPGGAAR